MAVKRTKTQISEIISGKQSHFIKKENAIKYKNGKITPYEKRKEIFDKILVENGKNLTLLINKTKLNLSLQQSESGKTKWYQGDLPEKIWDYLSWKGNYAGVLDYDISFNRNGDVIISLYQKKSPTSKWQLKRQEYVDTSFFKVI